MIVFCIDMRDKLIIMVSMKAQVDIKLEKNHEGEEVVELGRALDLLPAAIRPALALAVAEVVHARRLVIEPLRRLAGGPAGARVRTAS